MKKDRNIVNGAKKTAKTANLLGRDVIIIPSNKMSAHNPYGYILVESCTINANPLFLF